VLHVLRRVYGGKVDDLNTKGSRRDLPLSAALVERVRALRKGDADGWIFAAANGEPFTPGNTCNRLR
jgi:hypothetical protein